MASPEAEWKSYLNQLGRAAARAHAADPGSDEERECKALTRDQLASVCCGDHAIGHFDLSKKAKGHCLGMYVPRPFARVRVFFVLYFYVY